MAYLVKKTTHNGYRCACCSYESDHSDIFDTLKEAMAEFPDEFPEETEWGGLKSITIIDGSTNEKIAWGDIYWSTGYGKGSGYDYTRWSGWKDDKSFDIIRRGKKVITDKTWEECIEEVKEKYYKQKKEKSLPE